MKKRLLAALLTLCMVFTLLPISALADGEKTYASQDNVFYYILKPNASATDTGTDSFTFAGYGSVTGNPTSVTNYNGISMDGFTLPTSGVTQYYNTVDNGEMEWNAFPNISYNNHSYVYYNGTGEKPQYYYTVTWYRYNNNCYGYTVPKNDGGNAIGANQWSYKHVDGIAQLNDQYCVNFMVQDAGETTFYPVTKDGSFSYTDKDKTQKSDDAHTMFVSNSGNVTFGSLGQSEPTKEGYNFDGWYTSSSCTGTKVTAETEITGDTTYYGKFVTPDPDPEPENYDVTVTADPTEGGSANASATTATAGTEVTITVTPNDG